MRNEGPVGIAILAKAPIAGFAKTRLIPRLGAAGAAALQEWLLRRTLASALAAELGPVSLWCAPDVDHPAFYAWRGRVALEVQPDGDLGARMQAAVAAALTAGAGGVLVIGTDCPALTALGLRAAAAQLRRRDAVLVPAADGGYALIGLRQARPEVFTLLPWSTPQVMGETRIRLAALGWRWAELPTSWDVDHPADFERLALLFPELADLAAGAGT